MNQFSFDRPFSYPDGVSIDAMYGPWDNVSGLVTMVQNDFGFDAPKDGTEFAIKSTSGVKVYVWDSKVTPDANGYTYKEIGGGVSAEQLAAKQDKLSEKQLLSVNSGITKSKVTTYDGFSVSIGDLNREINNKQPKLNESQMAAVNSGATSTKVNTYDTHVASTSNPHAVTKAQVGLGNVDNTSDADKPISTATQTALNGKYAKPSGGIPKSDLASSVQTSLGLADTALQTHQDISGKQDKLATAQMNAVNSGITNTKVSQYDGYATRLDAMRTSVDNAVVSAGNAATSASNASASATSAEESAADAAQDASVAKTYLADLKTAINALPDGSAVSAQVAENTTAISQIKSNINAAETQEEADEMLITTDNGTVVAKINGTASDFKNLKCNGSSVVTDVSGIESKLENISVGSSARDTQEQVWCDDAQTQEYAKIGAYGIKAKAYYDLNGNPISSSTQFSGKRILFFGDSLVAASTSQNTNNGFVKIIADRNGCSFQRFYTTDSPSSSDQSFVGFKNISRDGTTLRKKSGRTDSVCERVKNWCTKVYCDLAVIQGGTNDFDDAMGTLSSGYTASLDEYTTIGALESMLKHCTNNGIKVCYIIMHKVSYIADNYYDFAKNVCKKWGVPYLDLTNSAGFYMSSENAAHGDMYSIVSSTEWSSTTTYNLDDKVGYNGKSYKCRVDNCVGIAPTNTTYWTLTSNSTHDFCHLNNLGHEVISNKIENFIKSV